MAEKHELEQIARDAAEQAVQRILVGLGIDAADPIAVQQDFARMRSLRALLDDSAFQADLVHLRRWRVAVETSTKAGLRTSIGLLVTGLLTLLTLGTKDWWHGLFK